MNICHNIERAAWLCPDRAALLFEGRQICYQELNEGANRFANALAGLGVVPKDRIALFLPNIPEFAICYYGIQKLGAVAVSLNVMLKSSELQFVLADSGANTVVTLPEMLETVPRQELPDLKNAVVVGPEAGSGGHALSRLLEKAAPSHKAAELSRDDPAAILYTSGTTGFPKGATLSHGNVVSNMYSTVHNCAIRPQDRLQLFLPLFHCFGQNFIMNAAVTACATLVLQRRFTPDESLDEIGRYGVTMFFGVPTIFVTYLNAGVKPEMFQSVRYFFTAAATMPGEISAAWSERFQQKVWEGYGLTETSPFASYNHFFRHRHGSIGAPIENVEMKVVDSEGNELPCGEMGEIVIKGPNIMLGYWNRPEETEQVIRDGWFHSGDVGKADDERYFYICDRIKDMVITAGFNVYPVEIENVIYGHPAVAEVAVYGAADPVKGEVVQATVVLLPGESVSEEELVGYCREKMAAYKVPRRIEFAESLPKSPTGKILKRVLRQEEVKPE